jgi:hypothetical protein
MGIVQRQGGLGGSAPLEDEALSKELRLLRVTGAVYWALDSADVPIMDAAIAMFRRHRQSSHGTPRASTSTWFTGPTTGCKAIC